MQRTNEELTNGTEDEGHASEQSEEPVSSRSSSRNSSASKRSSPAFMPQHRYSRDELLEISKHPLSKKIPEFLESLHFNASSGKWDPEKWFVNRRGDKATVSDEIRLKRDRQDVDIPLSHKRRTSDPRERVKEEKDEIILSPQRRSFSSGCHVNTQSTFSKRPGSPADVRDSDNFRESRRIGSGRIMNRERDRDRDWDRDHRDYNYSSNNRRDRYDQEENDKETRRYSNRYGRGRMRGHERIDEEEPEWFSGGPTSQSETIELVGFEDASNDNEVRKSNKKNKRNRDGARRQSIKSDEGEKPVVDKPPTPATFEKTPVKAVSQPDPPEKPKTPSPEIQMTNGSEEQKPANVNFDLDDLFKMEWLIPKESPPENSSNEIGCSRFTQWFQRDSPVLGLQNSEDDSRRSSLQDELLAHVLGGIGEPQLLISSPTPNTSDSFFAPISPALHSSPNCIPPPHPMTDGLNKNIVDLLQSAGDSTSSSINGEPPQLHNDKPPLSKSLKELEADLKRLVLGGNQGPSEEDTSAFNRLIQHMPDTSSSISMGPMDKSKALQEDELLENLLGSRPLSPMQIQANPNKFSTSVNNATVLQMPIQPGSNQQNEFYKFFNKQEEQRQQAQFEMQQVKNIQAQQQFMLQQQAAHVPKQNVNPTTLDTLAKMLETQPHSLSPVPFGMPNLFYGRYDRANINSLQRHREMFSSMLKPDQPQQLNPAPAALLHAQKCPNSVPPPTQTLGLPTLGTGVSPRQSPLPTDALHPQARIPSPLVFGQQPPALSHAPAPIHPNHLAQAMVQNSANSNTLQVQNPLVLQRVPSPQELAAHTQSILQNALIKRKLEEQKENYRKRQEAQRTNSPGLCNKSSSPLKNMSPTIAAFTPTSVMRKMHAEKSDDSQQKMEVVQNGAKPSGSMENILLDQNISKSANSNIASSTSGADGSFMSGIRTDVSHNKSGNVVPRPLYGQNLMNQGRSHPMVNSSGAINSVPSQGRPIVKGGNGQNNISMVADALRVPSSAGIKQSVMQNKLMQTRNDKYAAVHMDRDPGVEVIKFVEQQQRLLQQQQKSLALLGQQRRQNTSPMPPVHAAAAAAAFAFGPRHTVNPNVAANLVRPINITSTAIAAPPNINFPLLRTMIQANPAAAAAMRATPTCSLNQLRTLGQLAALQQIQRAVPESRPIQGGSRNFHAMTFQHLLNSQTQVAAQAQNTVGLGAHGDGKHLLPGKGPNSRQSPVNLTKWFGNDVLKQKMPEMPPVSHEKALRLEDIERQQQHSAVVHN